jgi:hypothetical protein
MISTEEVKAMLRELYKRQGYIVIGYPPNAAALRLGDTTEKIFQYDVGAKFKLVDVATQADWNLQNDRIEELRPRWSRFPNGIGGKFYKIVPIQARRARLSA